MDILYLTIFWRYGGMKTFFYFSILYLLAKFIHVSNLSINKNTSKMNLFKIKKHLVRLLGLLALFLTFSSVAYAQEGSVTGRISDEKGEMLIGVTVQEKGTSNGTVTDIDGQYTLKLSSESPVLLISYIGYKPPGNKSE